MLKGLRNPISRWGALGILVALPLAGCGGNGEEDPSAQQGQTASQPLSEEAQALVNQGNSAQREGRYSEALALFGQALDIHPDHAVPQFGSLLAATALGDTALVQSLREQLAISGPELLDMLGSGSAMGGMDPGAPGAAHMPSGGMPPGHPTFDVEELPDDTVTLRSGNRP